MRPRADRLLPALLVLAACVWAALSRDVLGDYDEDRLHNENAGPAVAALGRLELGQALDAHPLMGLVSTVARAPASALGHALGGESLSYRLGALVCLLALGAVALALDRGLAARGAGPGPRLLAGGVLLLNPLVLGALEAGHPEEILGAALCTGAVLAALDGRRTLAIVLLGLALGTKQWAVLAVVPVVWALPDRRVRALVLTGLVAAPLALPAILVDLERHRDDAAEIAATTRVYPQSTWWPVARGYDLDVDLGGGEQLALRPRELPAGLDRGVTSLLTLLLLLPAWLVAVRRGRLRDEALALLGALLLARCAVDPMNLDYYAVPAFAALLALTVRRTGTVPAPVVLVALAPAVVFGDTLHGWTAFAAFAAWLAVFAGALAGARALQGRAAGPGAGLRVPVVQAGGWKNAAEM